MARQPRPDFDGALHHVYNRGLDGRAIFRSDAERRLFLELLGMVAMRFRRAEGQSQVNQTLWGGIATCRRYAPSEWRAKWICVGRA